MLKYTKPTSQRYFEKYFSQTNIDWKKNYILPRVVAADNKIRVFQYKLLNNILFLNKMLFKFGIISRSLWSFCNSEEEIPFHIFTTVLTHKIFRINFRHILARILSFHVHYQWVLCLTLYRVITNHLLLIFKFNFYESRELKTLNFLRLESDIINIRQIEENDIRKLSNYFKKWVKLVNVFRHWTMYLIWKRRCFSL